MSEIILQPTDVQRIKLEKALKAVTPKFNICRHGQDAADYIYQIFIDAPKEHKLTLTVAILQQAVAIPSLIERANSIVFINRKTMTLNGNLAQRQQLQNECIIMIKNVNNYLRMARKFNCISDSKFIAAIEKTTKLQTEMYNWIKSDEEAVAIILKATA